MIFKQFQTLVEIQFSCKIKTFQSDGGDEFTSNQFQSHLHASGIHHQISCPYTPTINRLPSPILDNLSPYEILFGKPPVYAKFHPFGCRMFPCL
jgi:hypothetical protein